MIQQLEQQIALLKIQLLLKEEQIKSKEEQIKSKEEQLQRKNERILYLERQLFGRRSEKKLPVQSGTVVPFRCRARSSISRDGDSRTNIASRRH